MRFDKGSVKEVVYTSIDPRNWFEEDQEGLSSPWKAPITHSDLA